MYAAFVSAIIGTKFTIFEMLLGPLWTFAVPNKDICGGARCKGTYPNNIAKAINRDGHFPNMACIFWIEQHIGQCTSYGLMEQLSAVVQLKSITD